MKTLYLDRSTGDLDFDSQNNLRMAEDGVEQTQTLWLLFTTQTGEWFLDTRHGVNYRDHILGVKPDADENRIRATVEDALGQEPRVDEILSIALDYSRQERRLGIDFRVIMDGRLVVETLEVT